MQPSLNSKSYNQLLRFSATVIEGANNNNQHLYKNISATSSVRNFKLVNSHSAEGFCLQLSKNNWSNSANY